MTTMHPLVPARIVQTHTSRFRDVSICIVADRLHLLLGRLTLFAFVVIVILVR